ncbi:hypothetical protein Tco_0286269 [Tanacetum coccineum]
MHTRASNSELVKPLLEPERTLNRTRRQRNRRVPFDQRNNPPKNPRIVYPPILDINHFRHFLVTLENLYPMDDEPMWAADHVVAPTPGSAITILETANEFAIKDTKNEVVRLMMFPLSLTGEAKTWQLDQNLLSWSKQNNQEVLNAAAGGIVLYKTPNQAYQLAFVDKGSSNSNTDKIMARMDAMTLKMDAQYKELQNQAKKTKPDLNEDDVPMSREEEAKFM